MEELNRDIWKVVKGIFAIVREQAQVLERLSNSHHALLKALGSVQAPGGVTAVDAKLDERTQREIAELERLFGEKADS